MRNALGAAVALGLVVALVGCSSPEPPARSGLESLSRVRLRVKAPDPQTAPGWLAGTHETPEALAARVEGLLRERLPELDANGTPDDWVLEVEPAWQYELLPQGAAKRPDVWGICHVRVVKSVVVNGRKATAIAYQATAGMEAGLLPLFDNERFAGLVSALERAMARFAEDWRRANPQAAPQPGGKRLAS
ncbi:MAG TPA: hypothetical protein VNA25_23730 [Phycisphaerae bacterium]|nr:hypothetical protein [Phycisphaerae bacterium]